MVKIIVIPAEQLLLQDLFSYPWIGKGGYARLVTNQLVAYHIIQHGNEHLQCSDKWQISTTTSAKVVTLLTVVISIEWNLYIMTEVGGVR